MNLKGWATAEGTERYRKRFEGEIPPAHFQHAQGFGFPLSGSALTSAI
jgi:hypothetical protein